MFRVNNKSEFEIGRREREGHCTFRLEVAVAVIRMFKLRLGPNPATSKNGALKRKQKSPARIINFRRSSYQEAT